MGPFASWIIRVENLMDTPDCPIIPHMSFCAEAHSLLKYTHDPCEQSFGLFQHPTLKEIFSLLTLCCAFLVQITC